MQPPRTAPGPTAHPRRFDRPPEAPATDAAAGLPADAPTDHAGPRVPLADLEAALAASALSEGGRALARGLLRVARPARFPGGLGLDYAALLKTAARPDVLGPHVAEAARHLTDRGVDLLFVPGMSGYPVGAMYSLAAGVPAVLLKKRRHPAPAGEAEPYPVGAFVVPGYTGDGDAVVSADMAAVREILAGLVAAQLAAQAGSPRPRVTLRLAGADDIIDQATMALAVTETAPEVCAAVVRDLLAALPDAADLAAHGLDPAAARGLAPAGACPERRGRVEVDVRVVAWVTPLLKGYTGAAERLAAATGILPLAGLTLTALSLDPPAVGIAGLGLVALD